MRAATDGIGYGLLALGLFVSGLAWLAVRRAEIPHILEFVNRDGLTLTCVGCMRSSSLQFPSPRDYALKFDRSFRLLHARCGK